MRALNHAIKVLFITLLNAVPESFKANDATIAQRFCLDEVIQFTLKMLSPITPHISLYLWQEFTESGGDDFENSWPIFNEEFLQLEEFQLIIQVNGKVRGKENISVDTEQAQLEINDYYTFESKIFKLCRYHPNYNGCT